MLPNDFTVAIMLYDCSTIYVISLSQCLVRWSKRLDDFCKHCTSVCLVVSIAFFLAVEDRESTRTQVTEFGIQLSPQMTALMAYHQRFAKFMPHPSHPHGTYKVLILSSLQQQTSGLVGVIIIMIALTISIASVTIIQTAAIK